MALFLETKVYTDDYQTLKNRSSTAKCTEQSVAGGFQHRNFRLITN